MLAVLSSVAARQLGRNATRSATWRCRYTT